MANPNVSKTIPSYLRIHREPNQRPSRPEALGITTLEQFWQAYSEATGWRIDRHGSHAVSKPHLLPALVADAMATAEEAESSPAVSKSTAANLAEAAGELVGQLKSAQETIRRQHAELASRAAVIPSDEARDDLADELARILSEAATACDCDAAAMYLLDDDTRYLDSRAIHGLPEDRLAAPPRELRGSRGDLEAFVQGIVTVDDVSASPIDTWNMPESFPAGICASINEGDLPIGTLWLFAAEPTRFTTAQKAAAGLAASNLGGEVARFATQSEPILASVPRTAVCDLAQWQLRTLPAESQPAQGWIADGMIESHQDWAVGWHVWDVLPDGSLMVAIAEATDPSASGAMTAAVGRAALTAHAGYRHTPQQLCRRLGDTLWQTNTGDQLLSLLYARVDPETGEGEVASAGHLSAMIANRYGYRPLADGKSDPLGVHIESHSTADTFRLLPGETLFAFGPGLVADGATQQRLGEALRDAMRNAGTTPLASVRRATADLPLRHERGALSLTRR